MLRRIFNPVLRLTLFMIIFGTLPPAMPHAGVALGAAPASAASVVRADSQPNRADAGITIAANASPNSRVLNAPALTSMFTGECDTDNGSILREYWTGISGNAISDLTGSPDYPTSPSGSSQPTSFEHPKISTTTTAPACVATSARPRMAIIPSGSPATTTASCG